MGVARFEFDPVLSAQCLGDGDQAEDADHVHQVDDEEVRSGDWRLRRACACGPRWSLGDRVGWALGDLDVCQISDEWSNLIAGLR